MSNREKERVSLCILRENFGRVSKVLQKHRALQILKFRMTNQSQFLGRNLFTKQCLVSAVRWTLFSHRLYPAEYAVTVFAFSWTQQILTNLFWPKFEIWKVWKHTRSPCQGPFVPRRHFKLPKINCNFVRIALIKLLYQSNSLGIERESHSLSVRVYSKPQLGCAWLD